jgi:hypothetical protein
MNGCPLLLKLVKPIKVGGSWSANESGIDERLASQAKSEMRAARAAIHRKADAAPGQELARFDLACRCRDEPTKLLALSVYDRSFQVLDLRESFPHEHDQRYIGNSAYSRVAEQLRIKGQQSFGLLEIAACCCFPVDQKPLTVKFPNGIDVGDELAAVGQRAQHLQLQILFGVRDANAIVASEHLKEVNALMQRACLHESPLP